jgi:hypothetical protein
MKSDIFIAVCMRAIFISYLFQEAYFNSLLEINLLAWLITIAFVGSWIKYFIELKTKKQT